MNSEILKGFFSYKFEKDINDKMMYYSYRFEYGSVLSYIYELLNISLMDYVDFIIQNYKVPYLEASDIFQFSNFDDCTKNICRVIKEAGDKGYVALDIGKLLENDGLERKDGAYIKYGENQAKTAVQLGLLNLLSNKFFLSCFGFVFNDLSDEMQSKFINRLILRNKLIQRLIYKSKTNGKAEYSYEAGFLSQSTLLRRKSNVKTIINILSSTKECDLSGILSRIVF